MLRYTQYHLNETEKKDCAFHTVHFQVFAHLQIIPVTTMMNIQLKLLDMCISSKVVSATFRNNLMAAKKRSILQPYIFEAVFYKGAEIKYCVMKLIVVTNPILYVF